MSVRHHYCILKAHRIRHKNRKGVIDEGEVPEPELTGGNIRVEG